MFIVFDMSRGYSTEISNEAFNWHEAADPNTA
jgi:hypothetical protein